MQLTCDRFQALLRELSAERTATLLFEMQIEVVVRVGGNEIGAASVGVVQAFFVQLRQPSERWTVSRFPCTLPGPMRVG